jgi:predicted dehydrogenase
MTRPAIRTAVIGTGYLGRTHARILTEMPEATMAGFVDSKDSTADEVAQKLGIRRFDSVAAIAREIDCAVVATPTTMHFDVARELIEAGVDVLVEKPITPSPDDAKRLIDLAARHQRILQVGHSERYNPAITAARPLLEGIRYIEAQRLGVFGGRATDVDVVLDLMIHDLDIVLSTIHSPVESIRALGVPVLTEKVDITNVRLEMANGAVANLTASRVSDERMRKVRFFSTTTYVSADTMIQEVKGYRHSGRSFEPIAVMVEKKEPLRAELEAFLRCVETRSRPLVAGEDGLAAVELAIRVVDAINESLEKFKA